MSFPMRGREPPFRMTPSKGSKQAHIGLPPTVTPKAFGPVPFRVRGVNTGK